MHDLTDGIGIILAVLAGYAECQTDDITELYFMAKAVKI